MDLACGSSVDFPLTFIWRTLSSFLKGELSGAGAALYAVGMEAPFPGKGEVAE